MATETFGYALNDLNLVRKAVNALRRVASNTAAFQQAIHDLQLLETVLHGIQHVSTTNTSGDTVRNLQYCSHFCQPPLTRFLRSLKELEPHLCCALARKGLDVCSEPGPIWATELEGHITVLQGSIGLGLRVIDLLLWVEGMRYDVAAHTILPAVLQRTVDALQESLHSPVECHAARGHHYQNMQNNGGCNQYGDRYFFNGAPPSALIEALSRKLEVTAGILHADQSILIGEDLKIVLPQGLALIRVTNDRTPGPSTTISADVQPISPQTTHLSAMELSKLLLQCLLEILRTKLNAALAMLLGTIPAFRSFVRSLTAITRSPSWLLDSNITFVDARSRKVSLPYQWFRKWPHMLAHLQYEFKGTPGESYVSESHFGLFQESSRSRFGQRIPLDQWEDCVRPGTRVVMSMLIDTQRFHPRVCPSCQKVRVTARGMSEWSRW